MAETPRFYDVTFDVATAAFQAGDVVKKIPLNIGSYGKIVGLRLIDPDAQADALALYLYNAEPSDIDEADPFAPTAADLALEVDKISIPSANYETVNSLAIARVNGLSIWFDRSTMYAYLVTVGSTPTYSGGTLTLRLIVEKA